MLHVPQVNIIDALLEAALTFLVAGGVMLAGVALFLGIATVAAVLRGLRD